MSAPLGSVLARLDRELNELWAAPACAGEPVKSRVCTLNLVVVTGSAEIAARYVDVVDEVVRTTPARGLVVAVDPDAADDALEGDAAGVRAPGPRGEDGEVCSERVRLRARGAGTARVASAVDALLVPEVPMTLVWLGRVHVHDPLFVDLARGADRVILDTEYTSLASLVSLAEWARAAPGRPRVADIAWTRLSTWQELCARFFDDPAHRAHAAAVSVLELAQASEKGVRLGSEGALLLGWLATRLEWRADRLGGALRFRRPDGGRVAVRLRAVPRPPGVSPGALAGVSLSAEAAGVALRGTIRRALATGHVGEPSGDMNEPPPHSQTLDADVLAWRLELDAGGGGVRAIEQSVRLGANREARLLDRTLHRPPHDPVLDAAVEFAEKLDEDGLVTESSAGSDRRSP